MEKLIDTCAILTGAVEHEMKIGSNPKAESLGKLMANEAYRIVEGRDAGLLLALLALDRNINPRSLAIRRHQDFIYRDQSDAGIGELSGDNNDEFFLDRLDEAIPMMLCTAIFQERCSCAPMVLTVAGNTNHEPG